MARNELPDVPLPSTPPIKPAQYETVRVMLEGRDKRKKKEKRTRQSGTSHQFPRMRTDIGEMLEDVPDKVFSALVILGSVIQTVDLDVPVQFEVLPESIARRAYYSMLHGHGNLWLSEPWGLFPYLVHRMSANIMPRYSTTASFVGSVKLLFWFAAQVLFGKRKGHGKKGGGRRQQDKMTCDE
ncbi:hypothetical protein V8C43DRAFT_328252 [Trichoderma afarasin]